MVKGYQERALPVTVADYSHPEMISITLENCGSDRFVALIYLSLFNLNLPSP